MDAKATSSASSVQRYDLPGRCFNKAGFAETSCTEVRVPFLNGGRERYERVDERQKFDWHPTTRNYVLERLGEGHAEDNILVIGTYVEQLEKIAKRSGPLITGKPPTMSAMSRSMTPNGTHQPLVVSKVANFSIDLPDANIAIQISGTFGSRQEEAQRLGRILRPKRKRRALHRRYLGTKGGKTAMKRLATEQGYRYR